MGILHRTVSVDVMLNNQNILNQSSRRTQMKKSMLSLLSLFVITVISGCASTSEVVPYGKDSYIISTEDSAGCLSPAKLQVNAAKEANEYCAKQGKVMRVRNTSSHGTQGWTGTSSSLIFSCISESDPEYTRPDLRREPDTVIEDRRK
jgi:hypothetical protein